MTGIIEGYLREVEATLRLDRERKRQVVDELRAHLEEKADDLHRERPELTREEIERQVLDDFGDPRTLALAYSPEGTLLVKDRAGEVVLEVGRAVGRGAGTALKWLAVGLAGLLVLTAILGVWAFYEVRPYVESVVESNAPYPLYSFRCDDDACTADPTNATFYVHPEAREVRVDVGAWHGRNDPPITNATFRVQVLDPLGDVKYDRTLRLDNRSHVNEEATLKAIEGDWRVRVDFQPGWGGSFDVDVYALGLPEGAVPR